MSKKEFFPPRHFTKPAIYAYELVGVDTHKGLLKIGFTDRDAQTRIKEQLNTAKIVKDFELLVSLGVFNSALMNDAVYKFKRYEDASLEYIGINKHEGEDIGLYDTVINSKEYRDTFENVSKQAVY